MRHPSPAALLELHFEESTGAERAALAEHVRQCPPCATLLEEVLRLERALAAGPDDAPPPDGLQRVLARVARTQPARARQAEWARAAVPGAAALLAGWWAIRTGAERAASLGLVPGSLAGSLSGDLLGLSLSALAVVAFGAVVTLAIAPVLILDAARSAPRFVVANAPPRMNRGGREG
jgi:predicted anti-sigma-YlaC factor YlaD